MNVRTLHEIDSSTLDYQGLVFYLSQHILSKTDKEVELSHDLYLESSEKLKTTLDKLKVSKDGLLSISREISRIQMMAEIVSVIDILKREGVLYGNRKEKILDILQELTEKSYSSLKDMKDKLRTLVPEDNSRVFAL